MRNKVVREKSRCFNCNQDKSTFIKQHKKVKTETHRVFQ